MIVSSNGQSFKVESEADIIALVYALELLGSLKRKAA